MFVEPGQKVEEGETLVVMEAMKMEVRRKSFLSNSIIHLKYMVFSSNLNHKKPCMFSSEDCSKTKRSVFLFCFCLFI